MRWLSSNRGVSPPGEISIRLEGTVRHRETALYMKYCPFIIARIACGGVRDAMKKTLPGAPRNWTARRKAARGSAWTRCQRTRPANPAAPPPSRRRCGHRPGPEVSQVVRPVQSPACEAAFPKRDRRPLAVARPAPV